MSPLNISLCLLCFVGNERNQSQGKHSLNSLLTGNSVNLRFTSCVIKELTILTRTENFSVVDNCVRGGFTGF